MSRKEAGGAVGGVSEGRSWLGFLDCLSCLGFEFLDAFHGGQLLGHGAAEFLDGLADFGSNIAVGFVGDFEVAGVAQHHHSLERTLRTAADFDHFGDLNEMVFHALATVETGGAGGLDDGLKIAVIGVIEHFGEVPARPELVARRVGAADGLEWRDLLAHGFRKGL